MVYNGDKEVHYVGVIEKGDKGQDILLDEIVKGSMLLRVLKAEIQAKYKLPGTLLVYRDDEALTNDYAYLGDIVKPGAKLIFRYDLDVAVAAGGFGEGGSAGAVNRIAGHIGDNVSSSVIHSGGPRLYGEIRLGLAQGGYQVPGSGYSPVVQLAQWPASPANDIGEVIQEILKPRELTVQPTIAGTTENAPAGDAAPQELSVPETAEENNVSAHKEPTVGPEDGQAVEEYDRQSNASEASLVTLPSLPDRDAGTQPGTLHLMSVVPSVPRELEQQPDEERAKPAQPMALFSSDLNASEELNRPKISPRGAKSHDESGQGGAHSSRPVPKGFIQKLDDSRFRIKTRNRCNDVFEDVIPARSEKEAEAFFQAVDRYDSRKGPIRKLKSRLQDLYWTFMPPSHPGTTAIASLEEGLQTLDPTEQASPEKSSSTSTSNEPEFVSHATALAAATAAAAAAIAVVNRGHSTPDPHNVFICVPIGRPDTWKLRHAVFPGRANQPLHITDKDIFTQVRAEMGKFQKSRGYRRFLFPLRLSQANYYEFTLNPGTRAVTLGNRGRLPSDHPPPPGNWRDRWYFTAPRANEERDLRLSFATGTLTDAVRKPTQFPQDSAQYIKNVPWRLNVELGEGDDPQLYPLGWGFVLQLEFDMVTFLSIWVTAALLLSVGLLGLYIAPRGPAHGQPGVAIAIFMAPIGFVSTWFGITCVYAKQRGYLK